MWLKNQSDAVQVSLLLLVLIVMGCATARAYATISPVENSTVGYSTPGATGAAPPTDYNNETSSYTLGWLPEEIPEQSRSRPFVAAALPSHFDWRENSAYDWMTSVKNQGGCGSCVAFAAIGATEAQFRIDRNNPSWNLDLSEQHLFSCGGGQCGYGWYISAALNRLRDYGTPDEACYPYTGSDAKCSAGCADWQTRAFKLEGWNWIANDPGSIEAALMNGPLVAGFTVYTDFFSYRGGVYYHVSGTVAGGHAVALVGYDSNEQYWIVKNSWGPSWGEKGYFRIGFGEAGIENYVAAVRSGSSPHPPPTLTMDPASGPAGITVLVSGANYEGNTCALAAAPSGLFDSQSCSISAGGLSGSFTVASDASVGSYKVTVQTDAGGSDSGSNTFTVTPYSAKVAEMTLVPTIANVGQGSKITFSVTVQNTGPGDISSGKVQVKIYKPGGITPASSPYRSISSFKAGTERTVNVTYTLSSSAPVGDWTYGVYVYRGSTLLDQVTDQGFAVEPAVKTGQILSVTTDPDPVGQGGATALTVNFENTGNIIWSTAKLTAKIYSPDGRLYTTRSLTVSNIAPGIEYSRQVKWTPSSHAPLGTCTYDVTLTYKSGVLDTSAGNRVTVEPIVKSGVIDSVDAPDSLARPGTVTFTVTATNTGNFIWSSGKVVVKIHKPGSASVYATKSLSIRNIVPGVVYTYNISWAVSSTASTGPYTYDVYFYYGSSTLMDSKTPNTIIVN
jgi:C1A family cysteine protease